MTNLNQLQWVESYNLGLSIYEEQEYLGDDVEPLHSALMAKQDSVDLMDHITTNLSYSWRVQDLSERSRTQSSMLRTFEVLAPKEAFSAKDGPVLATILAYQDNSGGMWIELLINTDIRDEFTRALGAFLAKRVTDSSAVTHYPSSIH